MEAEEAMADAIKAKEILVTPSTWVEEQNIGCSISMGRGAVTESDALDGISEQSKKRENPTGRRWMQSVNSCSINLSTKSDGCSLQLIRKYSKRL